jgi:hypothetical protein
MTVTRETLMAFVDGELPPDEERRVAAEVAKDPALGAYVDEQRKLTRTLAHAFAPVLEQPVPPHIEQTVREAKLHAGPSLPLGDRLRRIWREQTRAGRGWIPVGAMAAGVLLGFALDGLFENGDMRTRGGALIAQRELARVLTAELASEQTAETRGMARIGVSFVSMDGAFCRSFETAPGERGAAAGLACLKSGAWQIVALADAQPGERGEFATAAGAMPAVVRNAVNAMMAGEPLDAAQERAARDAGWVQR